MGAMTLSMIWGVKWDDIQNDILDLARRMFTAILVLIFVGMLIGVWIASGTVPILIYWGLEILTPKFFLIVVCLTCSLMSLMTGTSWGTVGTIGIAFMGIAQGLGVPESYTAADRSSVPDFQTEADSSFVRSRHCAGRHLCDDLPELLRSR